jgi:hypothetical protein
MNEFEWLRQTRALRGDQHPVRDLWPDIAAALEPHQATRRPNAWLPMAATAAVVLLSVALGVTAWRTPQAFPQGGALAQSSHWKPDDPRLAGAAVEFQAADSEIRLAMDQAPDATFLKRIQQRTRAQQWQLQRYARRAP